MKNNFELNLKLVANVLTLVIFFINNLNAQQDEFIRGVFVHSGHGNATLLGNYNQVEELGSNSVHQIVNASNTLLQGLLSRFNYIYAANDSGTGSDICDWCNAEPENIDWISYFTHAKYMKWEAEGDPLFTGDVRIKHQGGEFYQESNGTKGWKTNNYNILGDKIIYGPNYWQYPRYTYTNPAWNPTPIEYIANFRMKIDLPSIESLPVCKIIVLMTKDSINYDTLALDTITTADLDDSYRNIPISYNYLKYFKLGENTYPFNNHPVFINKPISEIENGPSLNINASVEFIVEWLGNRQLFVDYIEVYDKQIWQQYFMNKVDSLYFYIYNYDSGFRSNQTFYERLKFYVTMDEPHSIDCYHPIKRVQEIMDNLNINKNLLVHWYPGWNHYRDGTITWPVYYELARPKKINFWYAPFLCDENGNITATNDFTLYWFQRNLQQAHFQQKNFFVTLQSFGWKDIESNSFCRWRTPTPGEISAETMLALAHGVKGLFYEQYYTTGPMVYNNKSILVEGLVDTMTVDSLFPPTSRWFKVRDLMERINGKLGKTLMGLEYTADFLQLRSGGNIHEPTGTIVSKNYLTLSVSNSKSAPQINFHAGFLKDQINSNNGNHHFLLTNLITNETRQVYTEITIPVPGFRNYRFRNVEPQFNFDTTYQNTFTTTFTLPAGEGYLFQVAPVVKFGGKLYYNDTIKTNTELIDDMRIKNNVNLVIDKGKYYTIKDTVTLEGTGFVTGKGYLNISQGGEINITSWSKSAFKGREGNHPKIYWGKFPYSQNVTSYRIYRRKGETNFTLVGTVSPNSPRYFVDNTVTILDRPEPFATFAEYKVTATYQNGGPIVESGYSNTIRYDEVDGIAIDKLSSSNSEVITEYKLFQNYPNPFNPATVISWQSPVSTHQTLKIYDILGNEVATLVDEYREAGVYQVNFDASKLSSGIYLYRITAGEFSDVRKMVILR